ncbi:MAG TPA: 2-phosphosulfolactate phosphatase [Ignavibacteriaceae bacterium]|nr:2-phosphosulfolactate phosphatase [Ignavibacteriaceae bacterium]
MKANVLFSPVNADELYFTNKTTVVIDVLRATSVITQAIKNKAKEVIPVGTVEFAVKVSGGMFGGQTLLGGERNTKKIEGFALGNSPFEYVKKIVEGKSIVFYTTNGTKAIVKAKFSENLIICSFLNLSAVAKHLVELGKDVEILCAGRNNLFSLEDSVCAGRLTKEIRALNKNMILNDSALAVISLDDKFGSDLVEMMKKCEHGKILLENGFEKDIEFCGQLNSMEVIPIFKNGTVKALS